MARLRRPTSRQSSEATREARVIPLINTHALPALSYLIPGHLENQVRPGTAAIVPLSGHSRLGVVVGVEENTGKGREYIRDTSGGLSIPSEIAEVCSRLSASYAIPLPAVLRSAMPPGLVTDRYRVVEPETHWPWQPGSAVGRTALKRLLGGKGLQYAEMSGRIEFLTEPPAGKFVEWATLRAGGNPDLSRAPRQRQIFESLGVSEDGCTVAGLLKATGASRGTLRSLVCRGAVNVEKRPEPPPVFTTRGGEARPDVFGAYGRDAGRVVDRGGAWLWRLPLEKQMAAVSAVSGAALEGGERALVLVPEIGALEKMVEYLVETLPEGYTVAPYHSGLAHRRGGVHEEVRDGRVDVLVGTRAAALMPMRGVGAICVVDEPNESHRAEPGYEGLPVHARDVALERGRVEGSGVLMLASAPSLQVYFPGSGIKELTPRPAANRPAGKIIDLRDSGSSLSPAFVETCRRGLEDGGRVAVVANRLGYATSISCNTCGNVWKCPDCFLPLAFHETPRALICGRCGYRRGVPESCDVCGSDRISSTGFAIERLRKELSRRLGVEAGLITAGGRELEDAPLVVATAKFVVGGGWDTVAVADADSLLMGSSVGAVERAFRLIYGMTESARDLVIVQTRVPDHYALHSALRRDYPAFAAAELPKLEDSGYPPYGHLAAMVFEGDEETVRRAVESGLRPFLEPKVSMSEPSPLPRGGSLQWRVLLRSKEKEAVSRFATFAVRRVARNYGKSKLRPRVEINPEEV